MISRRRAVVIPVVLVITALAATAVVRFRANQDPAPVAQDRQGPVLLVPGRNADSASLVDLQRRLFLTGRRVMIVSTGIDDVGDLHAQAKQVQLAAEKMIDAGAPSVDVVGYSAGGIVTRLWLAQGGSELARRVVTIGSPNQGATGKQLNNLVTKTYCDTTCPQLTPGSPLLSGLPPEAHGTAPWLNLWTTRDKVVTKPSAQMAGALNVSLQTVCPDDKSNHVALPADPLAVGIVLKALAAEPLTTPPTEAECGELRKIGAPDVLPFAPS